MLDFWERKPVQAADTQTSFIIKPCCFNRHSVPLSIVLLKHVRPAITKGQWQLVLHTHLPSVYHQRPEVYPQCACTNNQKKPSQLDRFQCLLRRHLHTCEIKKHFILKMGSKARAAFSNNSQSQLENGSNVNNGSKQTRSSCET